MRSPVAIWRDRRGRLSALRMATLCLLALPILLAVVAAFSEEGFGARPLNDLIHRAGYWALMFLLTALAVTPLTRIARFGQLMDVRRMIGVGAFSYASVHICLYIADQMFDLAKVASEIVLRIYLTIGFTALLGLAVLGATSTDAMVRRLGRRWQSLHRLVYLIALLAVVHFWMQSKLEIWEPTIMAGIYFWLMGYRLLAKYLPRAQIVRGRMPLVWLGGLGVMAAVATALGETAYFWIAFGVDPMRVIAANWSLVTGVRPAAIVLALAFAVTAAGAVRALTALPAKRRPGFA